MDILYNATVARIGIKKSDLRLHDKSLINFLGKQMPMKGLVEIRVTHGTWLIVIDMDVNFLVMDTLNTTYNVIMGITSLNKARAIVPIPHLLMKFPTPRGIGQA